MCPKSIASKRARRETVQAVHRESLQELMLRARLLEQEALRESDPARRSSLQTEADGLRSEARERLRRCVAPQSASG